MTRSVAAVLAGTFTLRFSTGLTTGLLVYYLAGLEDYGAEAQVGPIEVGILTATFYLAELLLSPLFGVLSDRVGSRRVMQFGPVFGAVAVVMTALTTDLLILGVTRWLEGAAAAASIPSILGYIAGATSHDEGLRGRVVARFEAATIAGLGIGIVAAGGLWEFMGRTGFLLNAALYLVSLAIYRYGVTERATPEPGLDELVIGPAGARSFTLHRYRTLLSSPAVWLLAPTWIAVNAFIGAWTSQSIFQLVNRPLPGFEDQRLMGGYGPVGISIGLAVAMLVFFAGLFYWGNRFRRFRRTTIMAIGIVGGLAMIGAVYGINHAAGSMAVVQLSLLTVAAAGLFVLAGATPAALGMLADISEMHPDDRGAIMGLYSVFLALGQIIGTLLGGGAAEWRGVDGLLLVSALLLLVALVPLRWLRASEHLVPGAIPQAEIAGGVPADDHPRPAQEEP